jgi:hypothetical protein
MILSESTLKSSGTFLGIKNTSPAFAKMMS